MASSPGDATANSGGALLVKHMADPLAVTEVIFQPWILVASVRHWIAPRPLL